MALRSNPFIKRVVEAGDQDARKKELNKKLNDISYEIPKVDGKMQAAKKAGDKALAAKFEKELKDLWALQKKLADEFRSMVKPVDLSDKTKKDMARGGTFPSKWVNKEAGDVASLKRSLESRKEDRDRYEADMKKFHAELDKKLDAKMKADNTAMNAKIEHDRVRQAYENARDGFREYKDKVFALEKQIAAAEKGA